MILLLHECATSNFAKDRLQLQPVHSHPAPPLMGPAPGQGSASTGPQHQALGIMHQHRTYHTGFGRLPSAANTRHTCTRLVKLFIKLLASINYFPLCTTEHQDCVLVCQFCAHSAAAARPPPRPPASPDPPRPRPAADISKLFPHSLIFANQKICHLFNYSNKRELESLG